MEETIKKPINEERVYIGKNYRFLIEQTIGIGKVMDTIRERYDIKELRGDRELIILVEEKNEGEKVGV